jgi:hypothetical protein
MLTAAHFHAHSSWTHAPSYVHHMPVCMFAIVLNASTTMWQVWDMASGLELHTLPRHGDFVICCALSADGRTLVSGSGDNTLQVSHSVGCDACNARCSVLSMRMHMPTPWYVYCEAVQQAQCPCS